MKLTVGLAGIVALLAPDIASARDMVPITVIDVMDPARDRHEAKLKRKFCQRATAAKGEPEKLLPLHDGEQGREEELSRLLRFGNSGCPTDLDLAIAKLRSDQTVAEIVQGYPRNIQAEAELRRERGRPEDLARSEQIARIMWLRYGPVYPGAPPSWTEQQRKQFLARDDVWAVLSDKLHFNQRRANLRHDLMLDPQSTRFDPVLALNELTKSNYSEDQRLAVRILLEGKLIPADVPRGEALLWKLASYDDAAMAMLLDRIEPRWVAERGNLTAQLREADKSQQRGATLAARLVALVTPGLANKDPKVQADSAAILLRHRPDIESGAGPALLGWIGRVLATRGDPNQGEARTHLGWLIMLGSAPARTLLDRELKRNPPVEAGLLTPDLERPAPLQNLFTANDYPTRALREGVEGVVEGKAVISPEGRVVLIEITSSPIDTLAATVATTIQRRLRRPYRDRPGRYVRVKLPPVQFRLPECTTGEPITPAIPGAILVDGPCAQPTLYSTVPISDASERRPGHRAGSR